MKRSTHCTNDQRYIHFACKGKKEECMTMKIGFVALVACSAIALLWGCQKKEETAPVTQQQTQTVSGAVFSTSLPSALAGKVIAPGGRVHVDAVNKNTKDTTIIVTNKDEFDINGWAFDEIAKFAPKMVFIELAPVNGGDKYYAQASRAERDDLAKAFNNPEFKRAAYILQADITTVRPGVYEINIIQSSGEYPIKAPAGKAINKTN
jgi:hypothetical protein